jgi:hypothetical protein
MPITGTESAKIPAAKMFFTGPYNCNDFPDWEDWQKMAWNSDITVGTINSDKTGET